ncbi:hypothetical protein Tco_0931299 [Tanacetum coccineum]
MIDNRWMDKRFKEALMIDELSIVETDKVNHTVETDMVKLMVEIECFGMSFDEFDKESGLSDGLQPKQADLSCVHALIEPHLHEIYVVPSKHEVDQFVINNSPLFPRIASTCSWSGLANPQLLLVVEVAGSEYSVKKDIKVLMIDELSIVETDKVIHTVETDMVKLMVEIECFGKSFDEFDKETGSSDGCKPMQEDMSCVHDINRTSI